MHNNNHVIDKFRELFVNGKKEYDNQKDRFPEEETTFIRCYIKRHIMWELITHNLNCLTQLINNQLTVTEEEIKNILMQCSKTNTQILDLLFHKEKQKEIEPDVVEILNKDNKNLQTKKSEEEQEEKPPQDEKKTNTKIITKNERKELSQSENVEKKNGIV